MSSSDFGPRISRISLKTSSWGTCRSHMASPPSLSFSDSNVQPRSRVGLEDPFEQLIGVEDAGHGVDIADEVIVLRDIVRFGDLDRFAEREADVDEREAVLPGPIEDARARYDAPRIDLGDLGDASCVLLEIDVKGP